MADESTTDEKILQRLSTLADRQKLTARSVADLAIGLNTFSRQINQRLDKIEGALVVLLGAPAKKPRRDTPESTDKFKLPAGVELQVPRATTKSAIEKAGKYVFYVLLFLLSHLANCLVNHAHWPAALEPKRAPAVAAPAEQ